MRKVLSIVSCSISWFMCVRYACLGFTRSITSSAWSRQKWPGCGLPPQGVDHEHVQPSRARPARLGDDVHVCAIRHVADAEAEHLEAAVDERDRRHRSPSTSNGAAVMRLERSWDEAGGQRLGVGVEGVEERAADHRLDLPRAVEREGLAEFPGTGGVVEAEQVVGVVVRVEDRVDDRTRSRISCSRISGVVSMRIVPRGARIRHGAVALVAGSGERQTAHSQPIIGTPTDVPVPRKVKVATRP